MAAATPSGTRPSTAIQHGADLIADLIEEEKTKVAHQFRLKIQELERRFTLESNKPALVTGSEVEAQLQTSKADVSRLELDALVMQQEAEQAKKQVATLKSELEMVKNALEDMGMVYSTGSITFKTDAARAAAKVINEAQSQRNTLHELEKPAGGEDRENAASFRKPSEFLGVFQVLMERDRRVVEMMVAKCRGMEEERKQLHELQQYQQMTLQLSIKRLQDKVLESVFNSRCTFSSPRDFIDEIFLSINQTIAECSNITRIPNNQSDNSIT